MAKPSINVQDEYNNAPMSSDQPAGNEPAENEMDIAVTPEQMQQMKQLAAAQDYEGLGRLVAPLLTQSVM